MFAYSSVSSHLMDAVTELKSKVDENIDKMEKFMEKHKSELSCKKPSKGKRERIEDRLAFLEDKVKELTKPNVCFSISDLETNTKYVEAVRTFVKKCEEGGLTVKKVSNFTYHIYARVSVELKQNMIVGYTGGCMIKIDSCHYNILENITTVLLSLKI